MTAMKILPLSPRFLAGNPELSRLITAHVEHMRLTISSLCQARHDDSSATLAISQGSNVLGVMDAVVDALNPVDDAFLNVPAVKSQLNAVENFISKNITPLLKESKTRVASLVNDFTNSFHKAKDLISQVVTTLQTQFDLMLRGAGSLTVEEQCAIYKSLVIDLKMLLDLVPGCKLPMLIVAIGKNKRLNMAFKLNRVGDTGRVSDKELGQLEDAIANFITNNKSIFEALIKAKNGSPLFFQL